MVVVDTNAHEVPPRAGLAEVLLNRAPEILRFEPCKAVNVVGADAEKHHGVSAEVFRSALGVAVRRAQDELRDLGCAVLTGWVDLRLQLDEVTFDEIASPGGLLDEFGPFELAGRQPREIRLCLVGQLSRPAL
ncbi:hypothetical protein [Mycolicibacterium sp. XJ2546]